MTAVFEYFTSGWRASSWWAMYHVILLLKCSTDSTNRSVYKDNISSIFWKFYVRNIQCQLSTLVNYCFYIYIYIYIYIYNNVILDAGLVHSFNGFKAIKYFSKSNKASVLSKNIFKNFLSNIVWCAETYGNMSTEAVKMLPSFASG